MAWTTAQTVISTWIGDDVPTSTTLVDAWIGRAERLLRRQVPDLEERVAAAEKDLLETIQDVVTAMVSRVFRNPAGVRTAADTTGPFGGTITFGGDQPGALTLLPEELAALTRGAQGAPRAYSVSMIPLESPYHPSKWPAS